jgi:predicted PP-loop superfamily ATPase
MKNKGGQICNVCILSESFPSIRFDSNGICNFCQEASSLESVSDRFKVLRNEMAKAIQSRRSSDIKSDYDCIVAYSGGKDSTYTLKLLSQKYGLRCLAITIDNGFMSDQARKNCDIVTSALSIDYVVIKPASSFMNNMYLQSIKNPEVHAKAAIKRASNLCNSCINLINTQMIHYAIKHEVPIVAGGYIGGQVPKDSAIIELNLEVLIKTRQSMQAKYTLYFGNDSKRYMQVPERLLSSHSMSNILILNPMLTEEVSEDEIIADISTLGWKMTQDTGKNSSNCRLNDLGIAVHNRQYGFNPYVFEISEQVRNGLMDRNIALMKAMAVPELKEVIWQAKIIGLNLDEL